MSLRENAKTQSKQKVGFLGRIYGHATCCLWNANEFYQNTVGLSIQMIAEICKSLSPFALFPLSGRRK
jgi:hypothetical protein